jgi:DNA modification methylase
MGRGGLAERRVQIRPFGVGPGSEGAEVTANSMYTLSPDCVLYHDDSRNALRILPDNSLDSCVTDPPYALVSVVKRFGGPNAAPAKGNDAYMRASAGFMGKTWDTGETAFTAEFWAEVLRVLKPGAFLCAFGASRGYHRMAVAIEDAGFEIRDSLMWIYGTGFPKSLDLAKQIDKNEGVEFQASPATGVGFMGPDGPGGYNVTKNKLTRVGKSSDAAQEWEGWGTALKPAFEPIVLARKPLSEGTVAANVLKWRTGALNIGACRVASADVEGPRYRHGGGIQGAGTSYELPDSKGEIPPGRWPANVVTDGSDEVVGAFPNSAGAQGSVTGDEPSECHSGVYSGPRKRIAMSKRADGNGSAARFFYSAKASRADRAGSKHPTVKPIALMAWLARLITPPGGVVLDPFAGSGTTGAAALAEGFKCVLIEREAEYVADIVRRLGPVPSPSICPE